MSELWRLTNASLRKYVKESDYRTFNIQGEQQLIAHLDYVLSSSLSGEYAHAPAIRLRNKKMLFWKAGNFTDSILLRYLCSKLRQFYDIVTPNRNNIVRQLLHILKSDTNYTVFKTDISKCFDSINAFDLIERLRNEKALDNFEYRFLMNYHRSLEGLVGIPWGLPTSSTLVDIVLSEFDRKCRGISGVMFYARYVDDILAVSCLDNSSQILSCVKSYLPSYLNLNRKKTLYRKWHSKLPYDNFPYKYLGYHIKADDKGLPIVSVTDKVINKFTNRVRLSFLQYTRDGNLADLRDRIRILTGNCDLELPEGAGLVKFGMAYAYRHVNNLNCLSKLDAYLRFQLARLVRRRQTISADPLFRQLRKCNFAAGIERRIGHRIRKERIIALQGVWKHA